VAELKRALTRADDTAVAWRLLAEAHDKLGEDGLARLATAEYNYNIGDKQQARVFAMRAREMLTRGTPDWRRATDIVLAAEPTREDLRQLGREGSIAGNTR
ncbi:MAG: M48 family peptidase, partial [Phenylobacterium sp.]|nr:M48 family peptidase [Phenylobacterium sp.]